jgi:polyphenol oxidase
VSRTLRAATIAAFDAVPGLVHGFEQRLGPTGWETREEGRRRVSAALAASGRLFLLRQVHGTALHLSPWEGHPDGDAGVAEAPGLLVGVETADCLPVLLVDPVRRAAAAVHAGWRGTAAGVVLRGVEALVAGGSRVADIVAGLGPGIGACCYEVGEELREAFGPQGEAFFRPGPRGRAHLDVRGANATQLERAGVSPGRIHHIAHCTFCDADRYHSFRRDGTGSGRMVNYVGWAA